MGSSSLSSPYQVYLGSKIKPCASKQIVFIFKSSLYWWIGTSRGATVAGSSSIAYYQYDCFDHSPRHAGGTRFVASLHGTQAFQISNCKSSSNRVFSLRCANRLSLLFGLQRTRCHSTRAKPFGWMNASYHVHPAGCFGRIVQMQPPARGIP